MSIARDIEQLEDALDCLTRWQGSDFSKGCDHCGAENEPFADVCWFCGRDISTDDENHCQGTRRSA